MDSQREKYITATKGLVDALKRETEDARQRFSQLGGLQLSKIMTTTIAEGVHLFLPTVAAYLKWLETVGVSTRKEMEELKKSFGDDEDVLKCAEELLAAETQFVELGAKFNEVVQEEEDKVCKLASISRIFLMCNGWLMLLYSAKFSWGAIFVIFYMVDQAVTKFSTHEN